MKDLEIKLYEHFCFHGAGYLAQLGSRLGKKARRSMIRRWKKSGDEAKAG
jgi:hypothetical protein